MFCLPNKIVTVECLIKFGAKGCAHSTVNFQVFDIHKKYDLVCCYVRT